MTGDSSNRLYVLDGVRALSILVVVSAHWLPLKLFGLPLNSSFGIFGMALFFVLSGYLITLKILNGTAPQAFISRRLLRVMPAAWLCLAVSSLWISMDLETALSNLLFYANIPPKHLVAPYLDHYWSLCLEFQFYLLAGLLLWTRVRLIWMLFPLLLLAVSGLRIWHGVTASNETWFRADDLLAGACLALLQQSRYWPRLIQVLQRNAAPVLLLLLLLACSWLPQAGGNPLNYLRPYVAAAWVAALLASSHPLTQALFVNRPARYIASISYAFYLWHLPLTATWLGSGDILEKYLKRPLLFMATWLIAHLSTVQFEKPINDWARRIGPHRAQRPAP